LLHAMELVRCLDASMQRGALEHTPDPWVVVGDHTGAQTGSGKCKNGGAITALSRNRDIVAPPESYEEACALRRRRPLRHADDAIDVRIAGENPCGIGKHEHVDAGIRPGPAQAADQRRRQQQVADATQRDDQDSRRIGEHNVFSQTRNYRSIPASPLDLSC